MTELADIYSTSLATAVYVYGTLIFVLGLAIMALWIARRPAQAHTGFMKLEGGDTDKVGCV